jgi:hypothetical protein
MIRNIIPAVFIALACAACAQQPVALGPVTVTPPSVTTTSSTPTLTQSIQQLATFTEADLAAADADAVANNDVIAHACYPALTKFIKSLPNPGGTVGGAFSAFQKARDLGNTAQAGVPTYLTLGCGPLVVDTETLLAKLAAMGAGAAGAVMTGGASLALPIPIQ